jgi:hypothetical protein
MSDIWFKPHGYGYGATPADWRGWAATGAFIAFLPGGSALLLAVQQNAPSGPPAWKFALWTVLAAVATAGFVRPDTREDGWTMELAVGKVGARM